MPRVPPAAGAPAGAPPTAAPLAPPPVARTLTESPAAIGVVGAASKVIVTVVPLTFVTVPVILEPPPKPPAAPAKPPAAPAPAAPAPLAAPVAAPNPPAPPAPRMREANPAKALVVAAAECLLPYQIPPETEPVIMTSTPSTAVYLLVHL